MRHSLFVFASIQHYASRPQRTVAWLRQFARTAEGQLSTTFPFSARYKSQLRRAAERSTAVMEVTLRYSGTGERHRCSRKHRWRRPSTEFLLPAVRRRPLVRIAASAALHFPMRLLTAMAGRICAGLKRPLSLCVVQCSPRSLIGSFHEIASYFGNPVGGRSGAVHLRSHRHPQGRFAEIPPSGRVKYFTNRVRTLTSNHSCRVRP
jgi:hypothetical protein